MVAELVGVGDAPDTSYGLAIRELPSLRLVRTRPLKLMYVGPIRCLGASGEHLVVFASSGPDLERRARLVRIRPANATTIWQGWSFYASFSERFAYVQVLARVGTTIVAVELRTGTTQKLGTVPVHEMRELTPNPAGTRLAGHSSLEGLGDPQLHVVNLERRPISLRSIPLLTDPVGSIHWFRDDRFAYVGGGMILVYSDALRLSARMSGWRAESAALMGSTVFGVHRKGTLVAAGLPSGPVRLVRRLPGRPEIIVSATS